MIIVFHSVKLALNMVTSIHSIQKTVKKSQNLGSKMKATRFFVAEEREIKLINKKARGKRKGIKKKKLLDTPYESNIY